MANCSAVQLCHESDKHDLFGGVSMFGSWGPICTMKWEAGDVLYNVLVKTFLNLILFDLTC